MSARHAVGPGEPAAAVPVDTLATARADAVDHYEITARLEANGLTDKTAIARHSFDSLFALSTVLLDRHRRGDVPPGTWANVPEIWEACRRAAILILTCVLSVLSQLAVGAPPAAILVAGSTAWVLGQACAGTSWARAGAGQRQQGLRRGAGLGILFFAGLCAVFVAAHLAGFSVVATASMTIAWSVYAMSISLLIIIGRSTTLLWLLAATVAVTAYLLLTPTGWSRPAAAAIALLTLLSIVGLLATELRRSGHAARPDRKDAAASLPPALHATLLAGALLTALFLLPGHHGLALVAATVVGTAIADPVLVLFRQRFNWRTANTYRVDSLTRRARYAAIALPALAALVAIIVVAGALILLRSQNAAALTTAVAAGAFSTLAISSAALTAFGSTWRAVAVAFLRFLAALTWWLMGQWAVIAALLIAVPFSVLLFVRRVSDPRLLA